MSIGVAVPCYYGHISRLNDLLDSIENQTVKPNKVVVSCSSTKEPFEIKKYSFYVEVLLNENYKNAAQNRNIAISKLNDMDYVTFMDADDIMHPQRIEILLRIFKETNCDIILHNYSDKHEFTNYNSFNYKINQLTRCGSGCIRHLYFNYSIKDKIHHSQSSVKQHILEKVRYPEENEYYSREDCVFCYRIFGLNNIINVYIPEQLSYYNSSGTQC